MKNFLKFTLGFCLFTTAISACFAGEEYYVMDFFEGNFQYRLQDKNTPAPAACAQSLGGKVWLSRGYHFARIDKNYGDGNLIGGWCVYLNQKSQDPRNVGFDIIKVKKP
ncbi:hypothetical protein [Snodgrassella sp. CS2]|uniref:hypothetical protein n=1 Tax=Snodgrassella sp. CS2 TaxID=3418953 RepID=UPI003D0916AE